MSLKLQKKGLWVALGAVMLAGAGSFAYYQRMVLPAQTMSDPQIQTTFARQGNLVLYASGSGTLIVMNEVELGFGTAGPVAEVHVQVGDRVQAGDILAVAGEREQLQAQVAADELAVQDAQVALDGLYANADMAAAEALLNLANAKDALKSAQYTWTVQQEGNRASKTTLDGARANLYLAQIELQSAEKRYRETPGTLEEDAPKAMALSNLVAAQQRYDSALRNLNWYLGHPTDIQQTQLDAQLAIAQARVAAAERSYQRLIHGPDEDELAKAQLALANAQAKLALSQLNLEQSIIVAPIAGTILAVSAQVGKHVSGAFISLADLSQRDLEIYLDETDIGAIEIGHEVEVIFDAYPDDVFTGHVTQIDPSLYRTGQLSAIRAYAKLDENPSASMEHLLIGMNASVDVISGRAEAAILVPVEALRELSVGEYAVFVVEDGKLKLRTVEVGLMDVTYAEILSGLQVGEVVSTGIVETQ